MQSGFANAQKKAKDKLEKVQAKVAPNSIGQNSTAKPSNTEKLKVKAEELREKIKPSSKQKPTSGVQAKRHADEAIEGARKQRQDNNRPYHIDHGSHGGPDAPDAPDGG